MKKEFSKFEIAVIKRTAQNVNPMVVKKAKLAKEINALQEEWDKLNTMQEQYEASIKTMTGGYGTEDLVEKVIEDTGKTDKSGRPIKMTKYVLKYPETVIPISESDETIDSCEESASEDNCPMDDCEEESLDLPFMD